MGITGWFWRLLGREVECDRIPEILGYIHDDDDRPVAVHRGPIQHESLTEDQTRRVARLREVLAEAYPMTMEAWVDGFLRDSDPESEIRIIEACAVVYRDLNEQVRLAPAEKRRLYSVLCVLSTGGFGPDLEAALPTGKGLPDLEAIQRRYREACATGRRP